MVLLEDGIPVSHKAMTHGLQQQVRLFLMLALWPTDIQYFLSGPLELRNPWIVRWSVHWNSVMGVSLFSLPWSHPHPEVTAVNWHCKMKLTTIAYRDEAFSLACDRCGFLSAPGTHSPFLKPAGQNLGGSYLNFISLRFVPSHWSFSKWGWWVEGIEGPCGGLGRIRSG